MDGNTRIYSKEAMVIVDMADLRQVRTEVIIKAVNVKIGVEKILAVRLRQGKEFEITLLKRSDNLEKGLMIKEICVR